MKKLLRRIRTNGFTLIELLTVIAIIAILAALLFPAIKTALLKAEVAQAQNDIKNIETALKSYFTEYGKWPNANGTAGDFSYGSFGGNINNYCQNRGLMNTLRSIDDSANSDSTTCGNGNPSFVNNPRKIVFLEVPAKSLDANRNFLDPWKTPYQITLDANYNNICEDLAHTSVTSLPTPVGTGASAGGVTNRSVVVWSLGPDGIGGTKDDVTSW